MGDRIIINILPIDIDLKSVIYNSDNTRKQFITDSKKYSMEITEFIGG